MEIGTAMVRLRYVRSREDPPRLKVMQALERILAGIREILEGKGAPGA